MRSPGSQALWGTSTWIWRRCSLIDTCGAGVIPCPPLERTRFACWPWTVRKYAARAATLAPWGKGRRCGELPMAIVVATSDGSFIVLRVIRKAVALASGLTRSSTRSAALLA